MENSECKNWFSEVSESTSPLWQWHMLRTRKAQRESFVEVFESCFQEIWKRKTLKILGYRGYQMCYEIWNWYLLTRNKKNSYPQLGTVLGLSIVMPHLHTSEILSLLSSCSCLVCDVWKYCVYHWKRVDWLLASGKLFYRIFMRPHRGYYIDKRQRLQVDYRVTRNTTKNIVYIWFWASSG